MGRGQTDTTATAKQLLFGSRTGSGPQSLFLNEATILAAPGRIRAKRVQLNYGYDFDIVHQLRLPATAYGYEAGGRKLEFAIGLARIGFPEKESFAWAATMESNLTLEQHQANHRLPHAFVAGSLNDVVAAINDRLSKMAQRDREKPQSGGGSWWVVPQQRLSAEQVLRAAQYRYREKAGAKWTGHGAETAQGAAVNLAQRAATLAHEQALEPLMSHDGVLKTDGRADQRYHELLGKIVSAPVQAEVFGLSYETAIACGYGHYRSITREYLPDPEPGFYTIELAHTVEPIGNRPISTLLSAQWHQRHLDKALDQATRQITKRNHEAAQAHGTFDLSQMIYWGTVRQAIVDAEHEVQAKSSAQSI